jgi:hypothetical protein
MPEKITDKGYMSVSSRKSATSLSGETAITTLLSGVSFKHWLKFIGLWLDPIARFSIAPDLAEAEARAHLFLTGEALPGSVFEYGAMADPGSRAALGRRFICSSDVFRTAIRRCLGVSRPRENLLNCVPTACHEMEWRPLNIRR